MVNVTIYSIHGSYGICNKINKINEDFPVSEPFPREKNTATELGKTPFFFHIAMFGFRGAPGVVGMLGSFFSVANLLQMDAPHFFGG